MVKDTKAVSKKITKNSSKKSTKKGASKKMKNDNKLLFWAVILVCLLVVLVVSLTYAYFTRNISVNGEEPETIVETGMLDVEFATSAYISNTNATLLEDSDAYMLADRTLFSVSRSEFNTVKEVYYNLQLTDINITDNLKSPYLKWRLYETKDINAETKALSEGDFEIINCSDNYEGEEVCSIDLYETKIPLAEKAIDDFTLLIWLSYDADENQNMLLQGTVSAKVQVTAVNENVTTN